MHQAKIGIIALSTAAAIVIVLGVFQRGDESTLESTGEQQRAAAALGRSAGGAVGQGWAAFGAAAAPSAAASPSTDALTRGGANERPRQPARTRGTSTGGAAGGASALRLRDPGDDAWRLRGPKREQAVAGEDYLEQARGERTALTSGRRIGRLRVRLPDSRALDTALRGRDSATVRAEVCVGRDGKPTEVRVVEGTGVAPVDDRVARQLLSGRYRPLRRDGSRVEFCERTTVVVSG